VSSEAMAEAWGGVSSEGKGGSEGSPYFPLPKFRAPYFNSDYIFVSIICVSMVRPRLSDSAAYDVGSLVFFFLEHLV
jgi:hypothetical protein